jgi:hypothetical protein
MWRTWGGEAWLGSGCRKDTGALPVMKGLDSGKQACTMQANRRIVRDAFSEDTTFHRYALRERRSGGALFDINLAGLV